MATSSASQNSARRRTIFKREKYRSTTFHNRRPLLSNHASGSSDGRSTMLLAATPSRDTPDTTLVLDHESRRNDNIQSGSSRWRRSIHVRHNTTKDMQFDAKRPVLRE